MVRLLARAPDRAAAGRRDRRRCRALRLAPCAQEWPRRRTSVHVRPGVCDRGNRADHLGQKPGRFPHPAGARFPGVYDLLHQLPRLQDVHAAGVHRDLRGAIDRPEEDTDRPDRAGRADASANGGSSRPQCRTHLHGGVWRRHRARRGSRRDRRSRAGDAVEHGRAAGADPVCGRRGWRAGLAAGSLHRLPSDWPVADLCCLDERIAVRRIRSAQSRLTCCWC